MTTAEAINALEKVVQNTSSSKELRNFKEGLQKLAREEQIKYLVNNYSIQELREMGFNI